MADEDFDEIKKIPKKILIFIILIIGLFFVGTISFVIIGDVSFKTGIFRTLEAFAFMFKEESGAGKLLEIFLSVFGLFLIWWIIWTFSDMALKGEITEYLKMSKYISVLNTMNNHYIIAGGGRVGEEIAHNLEKLKKKFVIIEKDPQKAIKLKKKKYIVLEGDANDVESRILDKANIKQASVLIIAMPETEKNLLLTLMAKEIKQDLDIYVRCDHPEFASRLKKAGAKAVIVPELTAATQFIKEIFD